MKLETTRYYVNDNGEITYYLFHYAKDVQLNRMFTNKDVVKQITDFLNGDPLRNEGSRRFVIAVPYLNEHAAKIVLGFEVWDAFRLNDPIKVMHFNYYPGRKAMTHTHSADYPDAGYGTIESSADFIKAFRHTYRSLVDISEDFGMGPTARERYL